MKITKINYSALKEDVFYKHIYPIYPKEFLFGSNYENFAFLISANFVLNPQQWEYILEHWEQKETILSIEDTNKQTTKQEVKQPIKEVNRELEALQNAANNINLTIHEYVMNDKRKTVKLYFAAQEQYSVSGNLDYDQMNHFLLGWIKCMKAINKAIN